MLLAMVIPTNSFPPSFQFVAAIGERADAYKAQGMQQ